MSAPGHLPDDWINAWIEAQKVTVQRWLDGQRGGSAPGIPGSLADWFQQVAAATQPSSNGAGVGGQMAALWGALGTAFSAGLNPAWKLPDVGPLREQQALLKGLSSALADYHGLAMEMAAVLAKVHADTLDLLARLAAEQANGGKPVASFKALYDLWIECGEVTYARVAQGDAYIHLQANLCNAAIKVQSHQQQQMERWLKQLDLPTRAELNTLHLRVQDLKKQVESAAVGKAAPAPSSSRPSPKRKSAKKS